MPIELRCIHCQRTLRVPDDAAGKLVKCPECLTTMHAPGGAASTPTPAASPSDWLSPGPSSPNVFADNLPPTSQVKPESYNPYAAPTILAHDHGVQRENWSGELRHTQIDFSEVLSITWRVFSTNLGPMAMLGLLLFVVLVVQQGLNFATDLMDREVGIIAKLALALVQFIVQVVTTLGGYCYCLQLLRTGQTSFEAFMQFKPSFGSGLLKDFLIGVVMFGLVMLCLMPGITLASLQMQDIAPIAIIGGVILMVVIMIFITLSVITSGVFLVDRRMGAIEALRTSLEYSSGNRLVMFGVLVITGLLSGLFACCTLYFGMILVVPYFSLLTCVMYLLMTGQRQSIVG